MSCCTLSLSLSLSACSFSFSIFKPVSWCELFLSAIQAAGDFRLNDFWLKVYQLAVFLKQLKFYEAAPQRRLCFCILRLLPDVVGLVGSSSGLSYMENQRHIDVQARADEMHKTKKKTNSRNRNLIKTFIITICVVLLP